MVRRIKKIPGSTLIEVLISLSLLGLVFGLGVNILLSFTGISSPKEQFTTDLLIKNYLEEPLDSPFPLEEERMLQGRRLIRRVEIRHTKSRIIEIQVEAWSGENFLSRRSLITTLPTP
ncbi:MAG: hypothetical protein AAFY71_24440 [Bacteroidota bacterium]